MWWVSPSGGVASMRTLRTVIGAEAEHADRAPCLVVAESRQTIPQFPSPHGTPPAPRGDRSGLSGPERRPRGASLFVVFRDLFTGWATRARERGRAGGAITAAIDPLNHHCAVRYSGLHDC
jgi:hypothetical protein